MCVGTAADVTAVISAGECVLVECPSHVHPRTGANLVTLCAAVSLRACFLFRIDDDDDDDDDATSTLTAAASRPVIQ
jgi:hypothetical protein